MTSPASPEEDNKPYRPDDPVGVRKTKETIEAWTLSYIYWKLHDSPNEDVQIGAEEIFLAFLELFDVPNVIATTLMDYAALLQEHGPQKEGD
jgi:hypothetical protein